VIPPADDHEALDEHEAFDREVMDLWREDVDRRARRIDPTALAERVLRAAPDVAHATSAARRWAAAAVVLIGLGVLGSLVVAPTNRRAADTVPGAVRLIEHDRLDLLAERELLDLGGR
jgi:hypothetical protein